jgi:formylmethanofuran dehydrogenase subunit C
MRMRGGLIAIKGQAKDFTGLQMKGGTILLMDGAEIRTGAWMNKGTIISMKPLQLMPTFAYATERDATFLGDYAAQVKEFGIDLPPAAGSGSFRVYHGDLSVTEKGEILVWQPGSVSDQA